MRGRWRSGWTRRARRSEAAPGRMRRVRPVALAAPSDGTGFARDGPVHSRPVVEDRRIFGPKFTKFTLATHFECTSSQRRPGPFAARRALPHREIPPFAGMTVGAAGDQLSRRSSHSRAIRVPDGWRRAGWRTVQRAFATLAGSARVGKRPLDLRPRVALWGGAYDQQEFPSARCPPGPRRRPVGCRPGAVPA